MQRKIKVKVVKLSSKGIYVFRWRDPVTGRNRQQASEIKSKASLRRLAERQAAAIEERLVRVNSEAISWGDFVMRYEDEHIDTLRPKSREAWRATIKHVEEIINPENLADIDTASISFLRNKMRKNKLAEASIDGYLGYLRAALNWAREVEIIDSVPIFARRRRTDKKKKTMRSRPIIGEEFDRMISTTEKIRPRDPEKWRRLLRGLWLSGLRVGEALSLTWSWEDNISVDLDRSPPVLRIRAEGEKGRTDRLLPLADEFVELLEETPVELRKGLVFGLRCKPGKASRVVSEIGKRAGVIVGSDGATAKAHDLRRSFAARWAKVLSPAELKILMRHSSIETTMSFYIDYTVDELSSRMTKRGDQTGDQETWGGGKSIAKDRKSSS